MKYVLLYIICVHIASSGILFIDKDLMSPLKGSNHVLGHSISVYIKDEFIFKVALFTIG